jgi:hypothetical protein
MWDCSNGSAEAAMPYLTQDDTMNKSGHVNYCITELLKLPFEFFDSVKAKPRFRHLQEPGRHIHCQIH